MSKILIVSIGLVLVIEGLLYFMLADNLDKIFEVLNKYNKSKIKTFSLSIAILGLCLIYFTFRFYS